MVGWGGELQLNQSIKNKNPNKDYHKKKAELGSSIYDVMSSKLQHRNIKTSMQHQDTPHTAAMYPHLTHNLR